MMFYRVYDGTMLVVECLRFRDAKAAARRCGSPRLARVREGVEHAMEAKGLGG